MIGSADDRDPGCAEPSARRPYAPHISARAYPAPMSENAEVLDWLLDSDPAIRWQVLRDILDAPEPEWRAERARVETEGWGARLLALEGADGQWSGGAFVPAGFDWSTMRTAGQPWTSTMWALDDLREWGLDPDSPRIGRAVALIGEHSRWDHDGQPYWQGEVEECINGRTVAAGATFGVDVAPIVARLLGEVQPDGGWNCERENGSVRSSFDSTICVLEGLLAFERAVGGDAAVEAARRGGEEFLLRRALFRRLSTGEPADADYLLAWHPSRHVYDVVRGLDYFRDADRPDPRLAEAVEHLRGSRRPDGRWSLDRTPRGAVWFEVDDGVGQPSRWITLRALRVLRWWEQRAG